MAFKRFAVIVLAILTAAIILFGAWTLYRGGLLATRLSAADACRERVIAHYHRNPEWIAYYQKYPGLAAQEITDRAFCDQGLNLYPEEAGK